MHLLFVCTANICRSPSAAAVTRRAGIAGVDVASAGTAAVAGAPGCSLAPLLEGQADQHRSRPLERQALADADLVLTAARGHQAQVLALDPGARQRTFTLNQAGRLARWILDAGMLEAALDPGEYPPHDLRVHVTPFSPDDRAAWLVAELDAARGMAPAAPEPQPPRRRWRRAGPVTVHPDDIPDPHELGREWHDASAQQILAGLTPLLDLVRRVQEAP